MRLSAIGFLMILTTMFLSGCAQQSKVAVENHGTNFYGRTAAMQPITTPHIMTVTSPASPPITMAMTSPQPAPIAPKPALVAPVLENVKHTEPMVTATPTAHWQWPVDGKVTQNFGQQANGTASEGITIAAAEGTPIHAAQAGQVAFVGKNIRDYGNIVILRHPDKTLTSYAHARDISVKKGDQIAAGGIIGFVGKSGSVKTPQLHFALREGDRAVDPLGKLPQHFASN